MENVISSRIIIFFSKVYYWATNCTNNMPKSVYFIGTSIALGIGAYAAYRYIKTRESKCVDEGFEDVTKQLEDTPEKRILVLGLENSGKTSLITRVTKESYNRDEVKPTAGFNVTSMEDNGVTYTIWEIGGGDSVRRYWPNFLQDTDLLVFVVDASDSHKIPLAVKEIKSLLGDERLSNVPVLVVASKKDKPNCMSEQEVGEALDVRSIATYKHKVKVIGTCINPDETKDHSSILALKKAIINMTTR